MNEAVPHKLISSVEDFLLPSKGQLIVKNTSPSVDPAALTGRTASQAWIELQLTNAMAGNPLPYGLEVNLQTYISI